MTISDIEDKFEETFEDHPNDLYRELIAQFYRAEITELLEYIKGTGRFMGQHERQMLENVINQTLE